MNKSDIFFLWCVLVFVCTCLCTIHVPCVYLKLKLWISVSHHVCALEIKPGSSGRRGLVLWATKPSLRLQYFFDHKQMTWIYMFFPHVGEVTICDHCLLWIYKIFVYFFRNWNLCLTLRYFPFLFPQGGTDLIINSYGPIIKNNTKKKWLFFQDTKKIKVEQVIHPCEENPLQSAA